MDHFNGIAALPEKMTEVAIRTDLFADGFAQFKERARVIDDKVGMHFEREALDAMRAGKLGGFLPIRNDFFFPLPLEHFVKFRGPAIGNPVWLRVLRRAARAARKSDDDFHVEHFREL